MSGTNCICTATVMLEMGIVPMTEPVTHFNLEAPGGIVGIEAHCRDGECERITFTNQPAFMVFENERLDVPGVGELSVDIAYGGACSRGWGRTREDRQGDHPRGGRRALPARRPGGRGGGRALPGRAPGEPGHQHRLLLRLDRPGARRRRRPQRQHRHARPRSTAPPAAPPPAPGWRCSSAQGLLALGDDFVNESITSTHFVGRVVEETKVGPYSGVVPTLSGRAWIYATSELGHHPQDPLARGHRLTDNWGAVPSLSAPLR